MLVLYDDDRVKLNFPLRYLPEGVREGDHLEVSFRKDDKSRGAEENRIDDLLAELKSK